MTYDEALKKWAKRRLLADLPNLDESLTVHEVTVYESEASGYCDTCWSPASIDISVYYTPNPDSEPVYHYWYAKDGEKEFSTMTGIVRALEEVSAEEDCE